MGEAWDPAKVSEDKELPGKAGGGGNAGLPGISLRVTPQSRPRATLRQAAWAGAAGSVPGFGQVTAFRLTLASRVPATLNACGTSLPDCLMLDGRKPKLCKVRGISPRKGATGRGRGIRLGPRGPRPTGRTDFPSFPGGESGPPTPCPLTPRAPFLRSTVGWPLPDGGCPGRTPGPVRKAL